MLAVMDHPGLLFGWRDPTLRDSFMKDSKEYTEEYQICLMLRLYWISTSKQKFKREFFEQCEAAVKKSPRAF